MQTSNSNLQRAKDYALRSLTCLDQTEAQIRGKLVQKGYTEEIVDQVTDFLKAYNYLNDERFVEQYVMTHCLRLNLKQLKEHLYRKGIHQADIDFYLTEYAYDEQKLLQKEVQKYLRKRELSDASEREKVVAHFVRKGYSYRDIRLILSECEKN